LETAVLAGRLNLCLHGSSVCRYRSGVALLKGMIARDDNKGERGMHERELAWERGHGGCRDA
jgi:hypothetical protein